MELITQMAETQKVQEEKLDELKCSVEKLQEELENAREDKNNAESLLEEARNQSKDISGRYKRLLEESKAAKQSYAKELNMAKEHWNSVELELKTTYEQIVEEMRNLEDKNRLLEEQLMETNNQLQISSQNENAFLQENEKLKILIEDRNKDVSIMQLENEKNCTELHNCKMQLLKERNINDRLLDEIRRVKKDLESRNERLEEIKKDKNTLSERNGELVQVASKDRLLEIELKEMKTTMNMLMIGNNAIELKISSLKNMIRGETLTVGVQTEMTNSDLDQYENMDKQATLMVMGLREQLVNLKQQFLDSRQENDVLKGFIQEVKRERDVQEESVRVGRLEDTVKSLSDMIRHELYEPSRESCILQALQEVKRDLNLLKARNKPARNIQHNQEPPSVIPVASSHTFDPSCKPVKLVTFRNNRQ